MIALWKVFHFFICLKLTRFDAVICVTYVESGKSVTLNPNVSGATLEDILWTYNGNKAAENDLVNLQEYGQFKGRTEIHISTGQLTVHHMTNSDSGVYQSVIEINGKLLHSEHDVKVIDALPEPTVTCEVNKTSDLKTLLCSVDSQTQPSYEWSGSNFNGHQGSKLSFDKQEENPDSVYTCIVKNKLGSKSTDFTLKDCHTGRRRRERRKPDKKNKKEEESPKQRSKSLGNQKNEAVTSDEDDQTGETIEDGKEEEKQKKKIMKGKRNQTESNQ
ncbi:SLAM family member 5-like [Xyrauchen texanus]|uniref:SLAM family member 5-like n=1 Tax=Xyrauchen texanus TaxID=154827 RepID=UPI002241D660|nr:SLAM family member 5-like [Xyrauchen texanus]